MQNFRDSFPIFKKKIYLDYASVAPFSSFHRQAFDDFLRIQEKFEIDLIQEIINLKERLKDLISKFIGSEKRENIALIPNTSYGISIIASGLNLKKGERILIPSIEFPANVYPYLYLKSKGIEVDFIKPEKGLITLKEIKKYVKKNTKLLSISFVQFLSGYKANLEEIGKWCRENEIIFIVDGIQGVGSCPINVKESKIDGLSCGGAKWLMWPQGTGFVYLSNNLFKKMKPPVVGWLSVENPWDFLNYKMELAKDAQRFEISTINFSGFYCAERILSIFEKFKIENIYKKILNLRNIFYEEIKKLKIETITPEEGPSGIVTLKLEAPDKFYKYLKEKNVIISKRLNYLRFSFHFINTEEDVLKTIKLIKKYKNNGA